MADKTVTSFIWTIKNFDMCPHPHGVRLDSPKFFVGCYDFCLSVYPRGFNDPKYFSAFLRKPNACKQNEVLVVYKMFFVDNRKVSRNIQKTEYTFDKFLDFGWPSFIARETITKTERSAFLPDNNLTIQCDILSLSVCESKKDVSKFNDDQDAEILSSDFAEMLKRGNSSDMVLVVHGNKFKVHKTILDCRCPQLTSLLKETGMTSEFSLDDIEASVLGILLEYLYTGTCRFENKYKQMLMAADAYNIQDLKHSLTIPYRKTITATTEIAVSQLSFRWIVTDFSKLDVDKELVYSTFYAAADEWSKMDILLTIVKSKTGSTGMQLKFRKLNSNKVTFIRFNVQISGTVKEYEQIFDTEDWITPLGSEIDVSHVLVNDTLNMYFEIYMSKDETTSKTEKVLVGTKTEKPGDEVVKNLKPLQNDLRKLHDDDDLKSADVILKVRDDTYHAHKVILCARSRVFEKMFEHDTLEKKEGVIAIEDIDSKTVSYMLRYMYYGYTDDMDISKAIKLYAAADKYELLTLRGKCANFLQTSIDADHVGELLLLADAHHDESLKKCVYDYIASNPQKVLESKDGLSAMESRSDLYSDAFKAILQRFPSND